MVRVDLRNDQRNIRLHAKCAGIGDHGAAGGGKFRFQFPRNVGVQRGKDHAGSALRSGRRDHHLGDSVRKRSLQLPAGGFAVGLAAGLVTGGKPCDFKPWVLFEQLDEALTNDPGGAKDANLVSCLHGRENILFILDYSARLRTGRQDLHRVNSVLGPSGHRGSRRDWLEIGQRRNPGTTLASTLHRLEGL